MAQSHLVRTGVWHQVHGFWVRIQPDYLAGLDHVQLIAHPDPLLLRIRGQNAGVEFSTVPPDPDYLNGEPQ